jgi:alanine transaminase
MIERDGYKAGPSNIFLTAGATAGIGLMLQVICSTPKTGILIPIPQYPLYKAVVTVLDARPVPYVLDEEHSWAVDAESITQAVDDAKARGTEVKCICVINLGNPTGSILAEPNVRRIFEIAVEKKLVVLADEVYQNNVFSGSFFSFKGILRDLQILEPGRFGNIELVSLHSTSKGLTGEGGHRGEYFELVAFHSDVIEQIYKLCGLSICPPVAGQCVLEMMVNPPKKSEESYENYRKEGAVIFQNMEGRASILFASLRKMEGVSCQKPQVGIYLLCSTRHHLL